MWCRSLFLSIFLCFGLSAQKIDFSALDEVLRNGVDDGVFPGAVGLVAKNGEIIYHRPVGNFTYDPLSPIVTSDTLFDLASLTKIIATTTAIMLLCDKKLISLDDPVGRYLPTFADNDRKDIRIKHLLSHTSGLLDLKDYQYFHGCEIEKVTDKIDHFIPVTHAGDRCVYAGVNMMILKRIVERVTGENFDLFVAKHITEPLGMKDTMFNPTGSDLLRCAPTADATTGCVLQGIVHDDQARMLGGVAGHAGLFSTAADVARYMFMILADGVDAFGNRFISPDIAVGWRQRQGNFDRGYGWEIGRYLSDEAFGHFGWTGTSMWADKKLGILCILLTNRVFPTQENFKIKNFRTIFHDCVMRLLSVLD